MPDQQHFQLSDFDFAFDEALIALRPKSPRGDAGMLVWQAGHIEDAQVRDLSGYLNENDLLVFNDTKVIPARISGERYRDSGQGPVQARITLTLLKPLGNGHWQALLKPARKVFLGEEIVFGPDFSARILTKSAEGAEVDLLLADDLDLDSALARYGAMPLPPYIERLRDVDAQDQADYQPIFAKRSGAVAAPTASLHFDEALLAALAKKGIQHEFVTLHVGAGTFLPVKVDDLSTHKMHAEFGEISAKVATRLNAHRARGGRVIAVGTTALRLLESGARGEGQNPVQAFSGDTDIFIRPGYQFRAVDGLITNFHLPKSTLLMLVAALIGFDAMQTIYRHATAKPYRFFSYGDMSLLLP